MSREEDDGMKHSGQLPDEENPMDDVPRCESLGPRKAMWPTLEKITKRGLERQRLWPARVTAETITPDQIREFYTNGSWPEKMVYCDMLKVIGDLAIRNLEAIAEFERRSDRDKALAQAEAGVVGFGVTAAFAACYRDAAKYLRQRPETEKCEPLGNESAKLVGGE